MAFILLFPPCHFSTNKKRKGSILLHAQCYIYRTYLSHFLPLQALSSLPWKFSTCSPPFFSRSSSFFALSCSYFAIVLRENIRFERTSPDDPLVSLFPQLAIIHTHRRISILPVHHAATRDSIFHSSSRPVTILFLILFWTYTLSCTLYWWYSPIFTLSVLSNTRS